MIKWTNCLPEWRRAQIVIWKIPRWKGKKLHFLVLSSKHLVSFFFVPVVWDLWLPSCFAVNVGGTFIDLNFFPRENGFGWPFVFDYFASQPHFIIFCWPNNKWFILPHVLHWRPKKQEIATPKCLLKTSVYVTLLKTDLKKWEVNSHLIERTSEICDYQIEKVSKIEMDLFVPQVIGAKKIVSSSNLIHNCLLSLLQKIFHAARFPSEAFFLKKSCKLSQVKVYQ